MSGSLTLSESGDIDALNLLLVYLVDSLFKGLAVYGNNELI